MLMKGQSAILAGASIAVGGLVLWRCDQAPRKLEEESARASASARGALEASKSEERLPSKKRIEEDAALAKIKFNLDEIRPDGLRGPEDGLVSVSYEFCVPNNDRSLAEVQKIAPGVAIHAGSRGRIGCTEDQALCIGSTSGANWREVLLGLAKLDYVTEIRECHFE
jgi:hypothetical protein